jgi:hypothetical protein
VNGFQHARIERGLKAVAAHDVGPAMTGVTDTDDDAAPSPALFTARNERL